MTQISPHRTYNLYTTTEVEQVHTETFEETFLCVIFTFCFQGSIAYNILQSKCNSLQEELWSWKSDDVQQNNINLLYILPFLSKTQRCLKLNGSLNYELCDCHYDFNYSVTLNS